MISFARGALRRCGLVKSLEQFLLLCEDFEAAQPPLLGEWNGAGSGVRALSAGPTAVTPRAPSKSAHRRRSMHHTAAQGSRLEPAFPLVLYHLFVVELSPRCAVRSYDDGVREACLQ